MKICDIRRFIGFDCVLDITFRDFRHKACGSECFITERFMKEGGFAGFRFCRFSRFFVIGRIDFIRRCCSYEGAGLTDRRSIFTDLERETIDYKCGRSDTIRLDHADGRIFGVIDVT